MNPSNEQKIKDLQATVAKLKSRVSNVEAESFIKVREGGILEQTDDINNLVKDIEQTLSRVAVRGAVFAKGGPLESSLTNAAMFMNKFLGATKPATEAFNALLGSFQQFGTLAETDVGIDLYTDKMTALAGTLREMGLSYGEFNKNVELATYTLNLSAKEVLNLNQGIVDFAKEIKMLPSVVSQNFQLVAKAMAYNAPMIQNEFKKIQQLSATTGVSVGTLMSGFGQKLDTLSGASSFAGKLNSILGQVVFSPNEILMMSESDRMVKVREAIMRHPIYGEIKSGSKLGVFALDTIRGLTGYSREDARRFLLFGDQPENRGGGGSLKTRLGRKAGEAFEAPGQAEKALTQLAAGMTSFTKQLEENVETLMRIGIIPKTQQGLVYDRRKFTPGGALTNQTPTDITRDYTQMGLNLEFGGSIAGKTGISRKAQNNLARVVGMAPMIIDVLRILQTLPANNPTRSALANRVSKLIEAGADGSLSQRDLQLKIAEIRDSAEAFSFVGPMDKVTPAEATFIKILRDKSGGRLGVSRDFLRFFRTGNTVSADELRDDNATGMRQFFKRAGIDTKEFDEFFGDENPAGRDSKDAIRKAFKDLEKAEDGSGETITIPAAPTGGIPGFGSISPTRDQKVLIAEAREQTRQVQATRKAADANNRALVTALTAMTGVLQAVLTDARNGGNRSETREKINEIIPKVNAAIAALQVVGVNDGKIEPLGKI